MTVQRIRWIDDAKGYAIVLVVIAHVWRGLRDAHLLHWSKEFAFLDHVVYSFHMPLFFMLSGLTAFLSDGRGKGKATDVLRLYYVYLFWSLIQISLMYVLSGVTTGDVSIQKFVLLPFSPSAQFWFLFVLIIFRIFTYVISYRILLPCTLAAFLIGSILNSNTLGFNAYHYSLFFALGYRDITIMAGRMTNVLCGVIAVLAGTLLLMSTVAVYNAGIPYDSILALGSAVCGSAFIICSAQIFSSTKLGSVSNLFGRYSLHIYILHIIAASGVRVICVKTGLLTNGYWLLAVCTIVGLVAPIISYHVMRKVGLEVLFTMKWNSADKNPPRSHKQDSHSGGELIHAHGVD